MDNTFKVGTFFRQGDVGLRAVPSKLKTATKTELNGKDIILAFGEVTGHGHKIRSTDAELHTDAASGRRFVEVCFNKPAALTHEEHDTLTLPQGTYEVIQQRTKSVEEELTRRVAD
jgi:hypothetical protein